MSRLAPRWCSWTHYFMSSQLVSRAGASAPQHHTISWRNLYWRFSHYKVLKRNSLVRFFIQSTKIKPRHYDWLGLPNKYLRLVVDEGHPRRVCPLLRLRAFVSLVIVRCCLLPPWRRTWSLGTLLRCWLGIISCSSCARPPCRSSKLNYFKIGSRPWSTSFLL